MSDSLWPHGLHHARLPCPALSPRVCSNSCPLSWWYYLTVLSSAVPFSFCLQSFPTSGSFPVSWLYAAAAAKSLQLWLTLCDPTDGSPSGSPIPGILQARILEWVATSFSNAWKVKNESEVAQSCPTLSDPMDCSLPGSSVHGIFQTRVLECGAIAFSWLYS